jgi:hypothetical protein
MQKNLISRLLDQMKPNPTPGHGSRKKTGGVRFSATQLLQTCYGSRGLFPSSGAFGSFQLKQRFVAFVGVFDFEF